MGGLWEASTVHVGHTCAVPLRTATGTRTLSWSLKGSGPTHRPWRRKTRCSAFSSAGPGTHHVAEPNVLISVRFMRKVALGICTLAYADATSGTDGTRTRSFRFDRPALLPLSYCARGRQFQNWLTPVTHKEGYCRPVGKQGVEPRHPGPKPGALPVRYIP